MAARPSGRDDSTVPVALLARGNRLYPPLRPGGHPGSCGTPGPVNPVDYTRFEKARIVGARALQLSMGAPPLIEIPPEVRNPVQVAMREYASDAIPLTVQRFKTHQVNQ